MNELLVRARGAYLGLAVGDALGATVEFMTPREIRAKYGVHREIIGGGWLNLKPGRVTDDTEMSLALGDSILACGGVDPTAVARAFSDWMASKPVDIGHTVRRGLLRFRTHGLTEMPPNEQDAGNGACMRVLPVALFTLGGWWEDISAAVRCQAHVTHNTPLSDSGTECVVAMIQDALVHGTPPAVLLNHADDLLRRHREFDWSKRRRDNPSGYIVETLQAVFQALETETSFEDILIDVVNRGGDADTTGAIAGMIAGASLGETAIPARWLRKLESATATACADQAEALVRGVSGFPR
ncbi:ADP-ribosyl-[dinitrogen reductase] hydrolase [Magnetospira thiophila]